MLQLSQKPTPEKEKRSSILKERGRLVIALSLLVIALAVVIVKDREFWFDSEDATDAEVATSESTPKAQPAPAPSKSTQVVVGTAPVAPVAVAKKHAVPKATTAATAAIPAASQPKVSKVEPTAPATNRATVPPLAVEVIAGDTHSLLHPGSTASKVEVLKDSSSVPAGAAPVAVQPTNAAERERMASVDMAYPLLGQHTKVQGSVVLQALVGTDGNIVSLRVLSGPAILAVAAQQAVRQWHFKPYMQNGQPVETKATVIVNFSIRVADNPSKTS